MIHDPTATLESALTAEVARMYEEVASHPDGDYHFYTGRHAAELYGYRTDDLDAMPEAAVAAFAGVVCPIERAGFRPGERVVDFGSGAGLDSLIAARTVGPTGRVVGIKLNAKMIEMADANRGADAAEQFGVKAVVFTASRPAP